MSLVQPAVIVVALTLAYSVIAICHGLEVVEVLRHTPESPNEQAGTEDAKDQQSDSEPET